MSAQNDSANDVRLDKWLWAARFFKTRQIARDAIEHNRVKVNGDRAKPSRSMQIGMELTIEQGWDEKTVVVRALSDKRGSAKDAALLYEETQASRELREKKALERKTNSQAQPDYGRRPDKRERREREKAMDTFRFDED
ncbi:MAG TPA: S4 domain-containing protein [Pseudomonadales bacterium]|nr:S4 domain-containing protein [Pseudomonadales bacterium]